MKRSKLCRTQDEPLEMRITKDKDRKRGLVLSGGGAKSIFQAQILKRLSRAGYTFDIISGVSAGSLNAAMASQQRGDIVDLWYNIEKDDLFRGGVNIWRLIKIALGYADSIYDSNGLEGFLRENYDPSNTKIPFIVGSVNLHTSEYNEFEVIPGDKATALREEEIYKAIIASSSIPLLFQPVMDLGRNKDHMFADGGLRNVTPLKTMIKRDVDEILVITCSPRHLGTTVKSLSGSFQIAERSFNILMNEIIREDIDSVLKVNRIVKEFGDERVNVNEREYRHIDISLIEPRFGLGGMLDFSDETQAKRIEEANNVCNRILDK